MAEVIIGKVKDLTNSEITLDKLKAAAPISSEREVQRKGKEKSKEETKKELKQKR